MLFEIQMFINGLDLMYKYSILFIYFDIGTLF